MHPAERLLGLSRMSFVLSARSRARLSGIHPDLQRVVYEAIQVTTVDFTVIALVMYFCHVIYYGSSVYVGKPRPKRCYS